MSAGNTSVPQVSPWALYRQIQELRNQITALRNSVGAGGISPAIAAALATKWPLNGNGNASANIVIDGGTETYDLSLQDFKTLSLDGRDVSLGGTASCYIDSPDLTLRGTDAFKMRTPDVHVGDAIHGSVLELSDATEGDVEFRVTRVESVAALRALHANAVANGGIVQTLGYYTAGDGGHGTYRHVHSNVDADDGGITIAPAHGSGRFKLIHNGTINVRQYGAKVDGTNALAAFRAAVAGINSLGGGTLFVPGGTYSFDIIHTAPFDSTKTIQLCSNLSIVMTPSTVLQVSGAWSAGKYYSLMTIMGSALYPDANNITIFGNGGKIIGVHPNQANDPVVVHGLLFNDETAEGVHVYDLTVEDCGTCAKFNCASGLVVNSRFLNGNNNCVAVTHATDLIFRDCTFNDCTAPAGGNCVQAGVDLEPNVGETVTRVSFFGCTAKGNGKKGIYFQQGAGTSSKIVIVGCDIEDNGDYGIAIVGTAANESTGNVVANNRLSGNGTSGITNASELLIGYVTRSVVVGNTISGNSSSYGIRATFCRDSLISANTADSSGGSTNPGILNLVACRGIRCDNNVLSNGPKNGIYISGGADLRFSANTVTTTGEESVYLRADAHNVSFHDCLFAAPCQTTGNQYVIGFASEQVGHVSFIDCQFVESIRYLTGTVSAYSAGTPSITFGDLASGSDDFYNGAFVLIGAERIQITDYVGSTRVATLASAFAAAPTPGTSTYTIVSARTVSIGVNSANANNGQWQFSGNDFSRAGASITPYYAVTASSLRIEWLEGLRTATSSASYTATLADEIIFVDASGGNRTVNLPTLANGRANGKIYTIVCTAAGSGTAVTVDGSGSETIGGELTRLIAAAGGYIRITPNPALTEWSIIGLFNPIEEFFVPAGSMQPATTNGAAAGTVETGTNKLCYETLDFDATTQEIAWFNLVMPEDWDRGTIKARFGWTAASGSGGVVWDLAAVAISDDDPMDAAVGTPQQVADTFLLADDRHQTNATPAITVGGTPAARDLVAFRVRRVPGDASDTLAVDARLTGVWIQYRRVETKGAW